MMTMGRVADSRMTPTTRLAGSEHSRTDGEPNARKVPGRPGPANAEAVAKDDDVTRQKAERFGNQLRVPSMIELSFIVPLQAQPQGSIRAFTPKGWTRPVLTSDNSKMRPFRNAVTKKCRESMRDAGLQEPWLGEHVAAELHIIYFLRRPKSVKAKKRPYPTAKPDLDKLNRCIGDALTGFAYSDDAQVVAGKQIKLYADGEPFVSVTVKPYGGVDPEYGTMRSLPLVEDEF
jgi:Holliday junction resolvase RusA-like endonuclease